MCMPSTYSAALYFRVMSDHHHHHHSNHLVDPNALPGWRLIQRSPEAVEYCKNLAKAVLNATKDLRLAARQHRRPGVVSLAPKSQLNNYISSSSTQLFPDNVKGREFYMDFTDKKEFKASDKMEESNGVKKAYSTSGHSLQLAYQRAPVVAPPPMTWSTNASSTAGLYSYPSPEDSNGR